MSELAKQTRGMGLIINKAMKKFMASRYEAPQQETTKNYMEQRKNICIYLKNNSHIWLQSFV